MKRREFLQSGSVLSLPVLLGGMQVSAITNSSLFGLIDQNSDKVLVLIQLNGGNDGLNTLIPLDYYDQLSNVRSNVIIPENQLLKVNDTNAFHPSMEGMRNLYDEAKVSIVQSVGYPEQNRSHFRSTDIWTSASSSDQFLSSGWLGRFLHTRYPEYPSNYPNDDCPDPFAMTLGYILSDTCQGSSSNYSIALNDPTQLMAIEETIEGDVDNSCYGMELSFIKDAIKKTNAYAATVSTAYDAGNNIASYDDDNPLSQQLKTVARLISGGSKTKIYVVSLGGFDTHADQVVDGQPEIGDHATLLKTLSDAMFSFQSDLKELSVDDRVLSMTFSEFGRRIRSNFSNGTDHGTAAPLFVFGKCVNPGIIGQNPEIRTDVDSQEGVAMQYDFRSVYASILIDWFDATETEISETLFEDFQYIPIVTPCDAVPNKEIIKEIQSMHVYPIPARDRISVDLDIVAGEVGITIYDVLGHPVINLPYTYYTSGVHTIEINVNNLTTGNYVLRAIGKYGQITKLIQKI